MMAGGRWILHSFILVLDLPFVTSTMSFLLLALIIPLVLLIGGYLLLVVVTLILAQITKWRSSKNSEEPKSAIYVGRVSHSRKVPTNHSFSYPIFMACVDLEDDFNNVLYPLSLVMSLRDEDHYKNKEGGGAGFSLTERTLRLVAEKTNNKFQPTLETHSIKLLTHLCYYGYCFNPVSFYYLQSKESNKIDAIVTEVSNTPWNEMQCYVLHKDSVDVTVVKPGRSRQGGQEGTNYLFQKTFHVSPFMDMDHTYDWIFWEFAKKEDPICASTSMVKGDVLYFNANLNMSHKGLDPYTLAWQLVSYPIFCFLLQLWIHYEAFFLFVKGVAYVPHPLGSETTASLVIGQIMVPFFAVKDWIDGKFKKD